MELQESGGGFASGPRWAVKQYLGDLQLEPTECPNSPLEITYQVIQILAMGSYCVLRDLRLRRQNSEHVPRGKLRTQSSAPQASALSAQP